MTRIFTEGFESGDALFFTYVGEAEISATKKRSGNYSVATINSASVPWKSVSAVDEAYFRFARTQPAWGGTANIFAWYSGANLLGRINADANRYLTICNSAGTVLATGTIHQNENVWYVIEVHIKIADAGIIEVKVDGILDVTYSGDTKPGVDATFNKLFYWSNNNYFDDIAMNDTNGILDNSWCGDGRVIALIPNGNGDLSQLTNSAGTSIDNYSYVDEQPANTTDYVEGSVVDNKDLYNLTPCGFTFETIKRVWTESRSLDTVAAGGLIAHTIKTHSTEYDSADMQLMNTYYPFISSGSGWVVNPNTGNPWTVAELDALQAGPKTRS